MDKDGTKRGHKARTVKSSPWLENFLRKKSKQAKACDSLEDSCR